MLFIPEKEVDFRCKVGSYPNSNGNNVVFVATFEDCRFIRIVPEETVLSVKARRILCDRMMNELNEKYERIHPIKSRVMKIRKGLEAIDISCHKALEDYRIKALRAACDLCYDQKTKDDILDAKTIGQIEMAMVGGRKRRFKRF